MKIFSRVFPWLLAVLSGVLLFLSFPPYPTCPIIWVALVPLIYAVLHSQGIRPAANLGAVAGLVFYGLSLNWFLKLFGVVAVAFWCVLAIFMALHMMLLAWAWDQRFIQGKDRRFVWVLLAGLFWTGLEFFRSEVWWLNNSWMSLGFSQSVNSNIRQSASILGIYGLSALVVWVNAGVSLVLCRKKSLLGLLLPLLLLAVAWFWGGYRMSHFLTKDGKPVTVALVQSESCTLETLARLSLIPAARNADLCVWHEDAFPIQPGQENAYFKLLSRSLRGTKAITLVGCNIVSEDLKKGRWQNFVWALSPAGKLIGRYDKQHPIPYVERPLPPNRDPRPLETSLGKLGIQICYDLDFENGTRKLVRDGAQLLVDPNLDPSDWGDVQRLQHSAMSPMRAVESGLWLVRAASSGVSQIIDPLGEIQNAMPLDQEGVLVGTAYMRTGGTFYSRWGWLFAPCCLKLCVLCLGWMLVEWFIRKKREAGA